MWRVLQITDSGFPTGGFAHSQGLEAAIQHGAVRNPEEFESFLKEALWQCGFSSLPFANGAHQELENLKECDEVLDVFLSNPIANRASRLQGRTFFSTCEKAFQQEETGLELLRKQMDHTEFHFHYASVFGATLKALSIEKPLMQRAFFQISLRGLLSAAVRLGVLGPYQAQQLQTRFSWTLSEILQHCQDFQLDEVAQTAPLLEIYQANQDRLYSRLFQS
jgi:urease accessory protein